MLDQPERFLWFTGTGWTGIGSIVSAVSIAVLSGFNYFYLRAAKKQANAAQQTLNLLEQQLMMSERPFVYHGRRSGVADSQGRRQPLASNGCGA
jgi:hypothetical protein